MLGKTILAYLCFQHINLDPDVGEMVGYEDAVIRLSHLTVQDILRGKVFVGLSAAHSNPSGPIQGFVLETRDESTNLMRLVV